MGDEPREQILERRAPGDLNSSLGPTPKEGPWADDSTPLSPRFLMCRIEAIRGPASWLRVSKTREEHSTVFDSSAREVFVNTQSGLSKWTSEPVTVLKTNQGNKSPAPCHDLAFDYLCSSKPVYLSIPQTF